MLRILTLNIRHGGGRRVGSIAEVVKSLSPDTVVLTEYRNSALGDALRSALRLEGWKHQVASPTGERVNGVLVAARYQLSLGHTVVSAAAWERDRSLVVRSEPCIVVAVYFPPEPKKIRSWERLLVTARALAQEPVLLIGDFNTGKHYLDEAGATFIGPEYLERLEGIGYVDAWRALNPTGREYTWFSSAGNGFRLDYAFLSPALAPTLLDARHIAWPRLLGITDHSALIVELQLPAANRCTALE